VDGSNQQETGISKKMPVRPNVRNKMPRCSFCDTSMQGRNSPTLSTFIPERGGGGKGEGNGAYVYMMYEGTTAVTADSA